MDNGFLHDDEFEGGIDLTPLLDAVFILIIFFAVATTFSKPVLDIILPASETAEVSGPSTAEITVSISREGEITSDGVLYTEDNIAELMRTDMEKPVNLYVDEKAPFESFLIVIDSSRKEGRDNVYISTEKKKR